MPSVLWLIEIINEKLILESCHLIKDKMH